jgi:hypothetical protein
MALANVQDRWLYRVGAVSAILLAIGYVAIIGLYVPLGAPPARGGGAEPLLAYIGAHTASWWAILGLSVLTDFLFLPVAFALYVAWKDVNRYGMILAATCVALFVILDLALTWTNYAVMIAFSGRYAAAVTEAQKSAVALMAGYPVAVLESGLLFVYNSLVLAAGILFAGVVMLQSGQHGSRGLAGLGLVTGVLGVVSVAGSFFGDALSSGIIVTSVLTTVWVGLVGLRLWAMGSPKTGLLYDRP